MDKDLAAMLSMRQQMDQAIEGMSQLATMTHAYYQNLLDNGFSKKDALTLTLEFQRMVLTQNRNTP